MSPGSAMVLLPGEFAVSSIKEIPMRIRMGYRQKAANGLEDDRTHDYFGF